MTDATLGTELKRLAAVNAYMIEYYTGSPFSNTDIDYDGMIEYLSDLEYDTEGSNCSIL